MTNKSAEWMSQCAYGPQPRPPHSVLSSHSLGIHSSCFREPKTAATQPMPGRGAAAGGARRDPLSCDPRSAAPMPGASTTRVGMKRGHNPQGLRWAGRQATPLPTLRERAAVWQPANFPKWCAASPAVTLAPPHPWGRMGLCPQAPPMCFPHSCGVSPAGVLFVAHFQWVGVHNGVS